MIDVYCDTVFNAAQEQGLSIEATANHVAMLAPDMLQQAARHAGPVLRQESPCGREIEALADSQRVAAHAQMTRILHEARLLQPTALWAIAAQHAARWQSHIKIIKMTLIKKLSM